MVDIWEVCQSFQIQDGGRQTGSSHISACRHGRRKIPGANPMVSRSTSSSKLLAMPQYVTGSGKFKMAAVKPEVAISQLADSLEEKFQVLTLPFRHPPF